jgi:hypothetical protein
MPVHEGRRRGETFDEAKLEGCLDFIEVDGVQI